MDLVERVAEAGRPLNASQLQVLLAGCEVYVTQSEAAKLFARYVAAMGEDLVNTVSRV